MNIFFTSHLPKIFLISLLAFIPPGMLQAQIPTITANPTNSIICAGDNTNFAVSALNATGYRWQVNSGAGYSYITDGGLYSGATTHTLSIIGARASMNDYTYRVEISGNTPPNVTSNVAKLTVNNAPAITTQPSASAICAGANTSFSVSASNATGYQWQVDQGAGYSNITNTATYSGATTATLTITGASVAWSGYLYRVVASSSCLLSATSNGVTLTVNNAPAITTQPSASTICTGANTSFSVSASNATGYQWQVNQGSGFIDISNGGLYSGATTATLTITGATVVRSGYSYRVVAKGGCSLNATSSSSTLTVSNIAAIRSQTNVSCNGGSNGTATVTASGGTTPYSYAWSNGATTATISDIVSGNYSVIIKDANLCQTTQNFTITQPSAIVISEGTIKGVSCNFGSNGTASVTVSGGTSPYTYDWNGTPIGDGTAAISGLSAGTYTVTITDARGCEATKSITITEPTDFSVITSQTNVLCKGATTASATVSVSGATAPYTYSWSPSGGTAATAANLGAGDYTVTIKDANLCQTTRTFTITEPFSALTASQGTIVNVNCRGEATGAATVNVSGGTAPYTYAWSPSGGTAATATGLPSGSYMVTVTDNNLCKTTQNFAITQPAAIVTATTSSSGVSCFGGSDGFASVSASGGTAPYTYSWAPLGGSGTAISNRPAGNYTCTITDNKGCTLVKNITIGTPAEFQLTYSGNTSIKLNTPFSYTFSPTGATSPFTYFYTGSLPTGLTLVHNILSGTPTALGTYAFSILVTDNNSCVYSINITITVAETLPVDLVQFVAKPAAGGVEINWQTLSESNSSHFNLLHATDNKSFEPLVRIDALGNSTSGKHYTFTDRNAVNGNNYYQLIQVDRDLNTKDYGIKTVNFNAINKDAVLVFPNPASNTLTVTFPSKTYTNLHIIDVSGKNIKHQQIAPSAIDAILNVAHLPGGIYTIVLMAEDKKSVYKFVKL